MATGAGPSLAMSYVDLSAFFGSGALDFSAIFVLGDVIYLGGVSGGAQRPHLVALAATPTAPGLDTTAVNATDLRIDPAPGIQGATIDKVDAFGALGGLLYLANDGAWIRATVPAPGPYTSSPADWSVITPAAAI